jgi:hypothetical protein
MRSGEADGEPYAVYQYLLHELEAVEARAARREFESDRLAAEGRKRRIPPDRVPQ